jgi:1,4-dihydroxy-2-naphthoyl-CoA hydrolase
VSTPIHSVHGVEIVAGTVHDTLGIAIVEASEDVVVVELSVGPHVHQPNGVLHGGVSALLAESAASLGSMVNIDSATHTAAGIELSVSHLRPCRDGLIQARAVPSRKGRTLHVWSVEITAEDGETIAVARCTVAIRPRPGAGSEGASS